MPTDATVAKKRVASCESSTAEALPCSASRAADVTSTTWSRSWPAAAVSCSGTICEHPQVLATLTLTLLRRSLDFCRVRRPFKLRQSKLVDGFSSRPRFSDWSWRSTIFTVEVRACPRCQGEGKGSGMHICISMPGAWRGACLSLTDHCSASPLPQILKFDFLDM